MRVSGKIEVQFTVELPDHCPSVVEDDPAIEAVVEAIPGIVDIYLWGEDHAPARVVFDVMDNDYEIEEDERHAT
jgi:hypothetical protein